MLELEPSYTQAFYLEYIDLDETLVCTNVLSASEKIKDIIDTKILKEKNGFIFETLASHNIFVKWPGVSEVIT